MSDSVKKILIEYGNKRSAEEERKEMRIVKIYEEYPEIKEIDEALYESGANNVKRIIKDPDNAVKYNAEYRKKSGDLKRRRARIIEDNGIDPNFDAPRYECEKCRDTGFLNNGKRCECFERKLINERYLRSNLKDRLEKESFEKFSFDFYSRENDGKHALSPYENISKIYGSCVDFCKNFDTETKGLLFHGSTGLGKTFLSSAVAKRLMDNGKTVIYLRATQLFSLYEEYRFAPEGERDVISDIYACDLLIIDDLGTEAQNKSNASFLFDLLNERFDKGRKLIINTNYSLKEITKMYSSRITSRIYENFYVYGFYGEDIRIQKIKRGM
ncbi:MAG: ATP-binding protein [Firmicutes bacterium]|nr:ATP-binding protein [Bacillota bacterium]